MSTPNSETQQQRRRLADQIANQLFTARLMGGPARIIERHRADELSPAQLHDILTTAPQIAADGDPGLVRVAYTSSGARAVIRLHGPDWSLILSGGRPMPDWLLAVHDARPLHLLLTRQAHQARQGRLHAIDLGSYQWALAELSRMCERVHAAITDPAA